MIVVPAEVVGAVAAHARAVDRERPGFESLGVLVCDGDRVVRYTRLHNADRRPYRARLAAPAQLRRRGRRLLLIHSHPVGGDASPSELDVRWVDCHGWDVFGIYSLATDELRLWTLEEDDPCEVAFEVVFRPSRPARREVFHVAGRDHHPS
jgi:proteasome lid subunit RPN8/RPN11